MGLPSIPFTRKSQLRPPRIRASQSKCEGEKPNLNARGPDQFIKELCNFRPTHGHFVILDPLTDSPWVDFWPLTYKFFEVNLLCWTDRDTPDTHLRCQECQETDLDTSKDTQGESPNFLEKSRFSRKSPIFGPIFRGLRGVRENHSKMVQLSTSIPSVVIVFA